MGAVGMVRTVTARSGIWRLAACLVGILCLAGSAHAAQISVSSKAGAPLITIKGELDLSDVSRFLRKTSEIKDAVVILESPGGNAVAGMQIGKAIRQKGFLTVVPASINCASACALAWLGGLPRFMAEDSQIGFHAAYFMKGGRPRRSSAANALIAAYLEGLGLPPQAITHITRAPPERLYWLTIGAARKQGIEAGVYTREGITSTVDKAPSGPAAEIKRLASVDLFGSDFPGMPIQNISAEECEERCRNNDRCAAFTFNEKRSACFLKASAELAVGYETASSGYRSAWETRIRRIDMTIKEATDYPGNDIDRLKPTTFAACLLACSDATACKAVTFITRRGECWLKNVTGSSEPRAGLVSAVK